VRAFAQEKLKESGEAEAANNAMLSWCLHASKGAHEALAAIGDEEPILDALNAEHANYRAALDWCLKQPALAVQSLRLSIQLHRYLMRRGHYREAIAWLRMALNAAGTEAEVELRADGLNILGVIAWYQGQLDLAKPSIQESMALWKVVGNDTKLAAALNNSALISVQEGDLDSAQESLLAATEIWNRQGDMKNVANAYANLGNLANESSDHSTAIIHLDRSLVLMRQLGDLWGVAMVLGSLAQAHMLNNDLDKGTSSVREALGMVQKSKDETLASTSLIEAAYLSVLKGQIQLAARLTGASDAAIERLGIELNVTHKRFRDMVVQAVNEANPSVGFVATAKGGRALPLQKAVEEALQFVESSELVSMN
jgi:tetratricopeptide (TPR) repeat protein